MHTRLLWNDLVGQGMMLRKGKYYVRIYLDNFISFLSRHTKPLPESLWQQVKEELFEGELTDEEIEVK